MVYNAVLVFTIQQADLALQINILFHNLSHYGLSQDIEYSFLRYTVAFPYSSVGKESVCMQETWVWFLGQEDPLEKDMATHRSIPAWRIPWMEDPGRLQSTGSRELDMTEK